MAATREVSWAVRACWYSGLMFAIASTNAASRCSGSLLRLQCHWQSTVRIRAVLGRDAAIKGEAKPRWAPRPLQAWTWGTPVLLLQLSLLLFLVGLAVHFWHSARLVDLQRSSDELKVRRRPCGRKLFRAESL